LPTAKPRTRSPFYSAPRRLFLIPSALVAAPALQRKGNPPRCQAARPGPLQRNSLITGWSPTGRKSCTLADRYRQGLGQVGPCIDNVGQVGVIQVPGTDPTVRWRSRCPFEGGRSSRRQPGRWGSSTSFYPLTYERPVGWDGAGEGSPRPPERPFAGS